MSDPQKWITAYLDDVLTDTEREELAGKRHPNLKFDLLGQQIEACHEIGVRCPIYFIVGWSAKDAEDHPEWCVRKKDGSVASINWDEKAAPTDRRPIVSWKFLCPSGDYRELILRQSEGKSGKGLTFAAAGPFEPALLPIDNGIRMPSTDYTVAFWFKTTSTDGRLFCVDRDSSWNNIWTDHVIAMEDGKLRVDISGDKPVSTAAKWNDGQWHPLVSTLGGASGAQKLYLDSRLVAEGKATRRERTTNRNGIDLGPDKGNCIVSIDDLRVYGRGLTGAEVQAITQSN